MAFLRIWQPRTQEARRRRVVVGAAAAVATFVLAIGFPFSTLLSQHRQLSAAAAQLSSVRHENQQLSLQERQLSSKIEIERRARQDYQLVHPGQSLFALLPGPGADGRSKTATTVASGTPGDPGSQPLVPPSKAADLAPDPGLPSTPSSGSGQGGPSGGSGTHRGASTPSQAPAAPPSSFISRVVQTLEFWH